MSLSVAMSSQPDGGATAPLPTRMSRQDKAAVTRATLIRVGRQLFAEHGYFAIGTPELVAAMQMTRGALYHHFRNKQELFEAVFQDVERELVEEAIAAMGPVPDDAWVRIRRGARAYLEAVAASPSRQRILLIDGPAVLGWDRWRQMESASFRKRLEDHVMGLMDADVLPKVSAVALGQLLIAAFHEAALAIAHAPEAERTQVHNDMLASLHALIDAVGSPGKVAPPTDLG